MSTYVTREVQIISIVASFVFVPLVNELAGMTTGIVLVVAEEELGVEGESE